MIVLTVIVVPSRRIRRPRRKGAILFLQEGNPCFNPGMVVKTIGAVEIEIPARTIHVGAAVRIDFAYIAHVKVHIHIELTHVARGNAAINGLFPAAQVRSDITAGFLVFLRDDVDDAAHGVTPIKSGARAADNLNAVNGVDVHAVQLIDIHGLP